MSPVEGKGKQRDTTLAIEAITLTELEDDGDASIMTSPSMIGEMQEKLVWYRKVGLVIDWLRLLPDIYYILLLRNLEYWKG